MTGCYPGGMTSATLLPGEDSPCNNCEYERNCPYWIGADMRDDCTGNRNDIEEYITMKEDEEKELCATCEQEDGCKFRERNKCIKEAIY